MTIVYHAGHITGLAADTKPISVPTFSIFVETDTDKQFLFDGVTWNVLSGGVVGKQVLAADATEESVTGTTITQVKDMSFIKGVVDYALLTIEIELKTDNITNPAHCRVRHDGLGTDDLDLTTSSTSFVILSGTIDTSSFTTGRHTVEFFLDDGAGETATLRETWVYGET